MEKVDCVETIILYLSELNKIKKATMDAIKDCNMANAIDCVHKFNSGVGMVSASIITFHGVLDDAEIIRYHATLNQIAKEFREETVKLAKKCRGFAE